MKAHLVLKANIDALLRARNLKRKDLAQWCRRTEAWLSQILANPERNMPLKYLDRIADFFRLETYQLFQPGLLPTTERRFGQDRRSGVDRRYQLAEDVLREPPSVADLEHRMRTLTPAEYRRFAKGAEAALALASTSRTTRQPDPRPTTDGPSAPSARNRSARQK